MVVLDHNHMMSQSKSHYFHCNRRISAYVRYQINLNDQTEIRMNKFFGSLVLKYGGYENISCDEKDCRNLVEESRRLRLSEGDASAIRDTFRGWLQKTLIFFDIPFE